MSVVSRPLPPVRRVLLRDQALTLLREAIVTGDLAPGEVIKDADLAERLGLSVAPVRAALARLADEGLVEAKPQSHTRVTPLVPQQVRDAAVVVRSMHELAAREAVPLLADEDVAALRAANERFTTALAAADVDEAMAADDDLHGVLLARCGNAAVLATVARFTPAIRRLERRRFATDSGRSSVELHDRLIAACAAHDADAAVATTTEIWTALLSELEETTMSLCADFPRYPLLFGPSPVHRLDRLTEHLGGAAVWAKREDVNSGIAFGGNKTRKLEYLVADALAQGCDTLVSIGGVQSNHTRQVAAVAARVGMACVLIQESWVDWPDAVYDKVGNILISRLAGADVRLVKAGFGIGFKESWEAALAEIEARGGKPYAIPAGASDHPLGGHGFAGWAHEVAAQEAELDVFFDTVVVCSVTGSTQAGMVAGFAQLEEQGARPRRVLGIDASAKPAETRDQVLRIAQRTARAIGVRRELTLDDVELDERYHAGIYGIPDATTIAAMELAARTEGMVTDPVYEGKSMAATIDLVGRGEIDRSSTVLYAHLGGQPALNGYSALFS